MKKGKETSTYIDYRERLKNDDMKIFLKKENLYYQNLLIYDIIIGLFKKF